MKYLKIALFIAILRYVFIALNRQIILEDPHDGWVNYFYLPAGLNVIAILTSGYIGAAGVAIGSLVWNLRNNSIDSPTAITLSVAPFLSCSISYWTYSIFHNTYRTNDWHAPTVNDYIKIALTYAIVNSTLHHAIFPIVFGSELFSSATYLEMMLGDIFGAMIVFIVFNIVASLSLDILKKYIN